MMPVEKEVEETLVDYLDYSDIFRRSSKKGVHEVHVRVWGYLKWKERRKVKTGWRNWEDW